MYNNTPIKYTNRMFIRQVTLKKINYFKTFVLFIYIGLSLIIITYYR